MRRVYMDHNATTPVHPEVLEAMMPFFRDQFGNASSIHWAGREVKKYLDEAREKVAALMNADPQEILFTGCGTESDNMAIKGVASIHQDKGRHIDHQQSGTSCGSPHLPFHGGIGLRGHLPIRRGKNLYWLPKLPNRDY